MAFIAQGIRIDVSIYTPTANQGHRIVDNNIAEIIKGFDIMSHQRKKRFSEEM